MATVMDNQPYCLVLGGGGAKGVYHIGVWQALRELDIPVNAFIGNSIGAIVSAFLAQGAEQELLDIAHSINLNSLIKLSKNDSFSDEQTFQTHSIRHWQSAYKKIVEKRGLDTSPMRSMLESVIDEEKIRATNYDFGITTVNVTDFKPREIFVEEMEQGQLLNYIMASAAFPGFEQPKIEGKKYVDGGLYDNIPYSMAKRRGYRKIILVDISGMGFNRRPKTEGMHTVYIKNSIDMGNAFDFTPEFINDFWKLGYLDTHRAFASLTGYRYFLIPDQNIEQTWMSKNKATYEQERNKLKPIFPDEMKHDKRLLLKTLEVCANLLDIQRIEKYSYSSLKQAINLELEDTELQVENILIERNLNEETPPHKIIDAFAREVIQSKWFSENPYYYYLLTQRFQHNKAIEIAMTSLMKLKPELEVLNFYINNIRECNFP